MTSHYLFSAVQIGKEKVQLKKLFYSIIAFSFYTCAGRHSLSTYDDYAEIGAEAGFGFWGSAGKICVLPLQNCAVCRNKKMNETKLLFM